MALLRKTSHTEMTKITEKTYVSLGLVIVIIGGIGWLTSIYWKTESNASELIKYSEKYEKLEIVLQSMDRRLSRIEGKLGVNNRETK